MLNKPPYLSYLNAYIHSPLHVYFVIYYIQQNNFESSYTDVIVWPVYDSLHALSSTILQTAFCFTGVFICELYLCLKKINANHFTICLFLTQHIDWKAPLYVGEHFHLSLNKVAYFSAINIVNPFSDKINLATIEKAAHFILA